MAGFSVTVVDETGSFGSYAASIASNTLAAANLWQARLQRQADIEISVVIRPLVGSLLAQAGSLSSGFIGNFNGYRVSQAGAAYELQTGIDPNDGADDIRITVNSVSLARLWFDPTPLTDDGDVPGSSFDAVSLFLHEIGHGLGFNGFRDPFSGELSGSSMSAYDRYVEMRMGQPYFVGPNAVQAYGGAVPLTLGSLGHYGNPAGPGAELSTGVMWSTLAGGRRRSVSALDLAILKDTGLDVAAAEISLRGSYRNYLISLTADRRLRVEEKGSSGNPVRYLTESGSLRFADGTALFDPTGAGARTARLYGGALGRAPDAGGLEHHMALLNNQTISLSAMANAFIVSPEFIARFGTPDNAGFVTRMYDNVLGRLPDAGGLAGWVGQLAGGMARETLLLGFTESVENRIATLATIGDGKVAQAYRLYRAALAREPDSAGLANWTGLVDRGVAMAEIAQHFIMSAEFNAKYGALSNPDFITNMYLNALGRSPDAGGHAGWTQALNGGLSRAAVLVGFSDSTENRAATAAATHDGWVFAR